MEVGRIDCWRIGDTRPFSHAAIVAREFGIPFVTGAIDATRVITDGATIVVDGTAGVVEL